MSASPLMLRRCRCIPGSTVPSSKPKKKKEKTVVMYMKVVVARLYPEIDMSPQYVCIIFFYLYSDTRGKSLWQRGRKKPKRSCQYKRFLFCLGYSSRPSTKYFFPHCILFQFRCPHPPASYRKAVVQRPLSLKMCLWLMAIPYGRAGTWCG
jgi:hypothetical protein